MATLEIELEKMASRLEEALWLLHRHADITKDFETVNWKAMKKWKEQRDAFLRQSNA